MPDDRDAAKAAIVLQVLRKYGRVGNVVVKAEIRFALRSGATRADAALIVAKRRYSAACEIFGEDTLCIGVQSGPIAVAIGRTGSGNDQRHRKRSDSGGNGQYPREPYRAGIDRDRLLRKRCRCGNPRSDDQRER